MLVSHCFSFFTDATVVVNEKMLEENAETALSHNDLVSNEGLSTTLEESHIDMTASFIETATASKTTTTTTETALPAAEEEENTSPPHSVVETSLETPSTTTDCRTPSFVSLKEPNSPGKSASAAKVKSTPIAAATAAVPRRALKTAAKTTGLTSRQLPNVQQFNCFSEQKGVMISRKRACFSTNLFDEEKPSKQKDDVMDQKAENALNHNDMTNKLIIRPSLSEFPFFSFTLLISHCFSFFIFCYRRHRTRQ